MLCRGRQDTNALAIVPTLPPFVGVAKALGLAANSMCVPRAPGQEIGGIARLEVQTAVLIGAVRVVASRGDASSRHRRETTAIARARVFSRRKGRPPPPSDDENSPPRTTLGTRAERRAAARLGSARFGLGRRVRELDADGGATSMTINVEYNQLDPLLRATVSPAGDVADPATGFSPYPGNINQLLFSLPTYAATLARTQGVMGEFVNPKYKDAARDAFKKPTRLECMMQDFPKARDRGAPSGSRARARAERAAAAAARALASSPRRSALALALALYFTAGKQRDAASHSVWRRASISPRA